MRNLAIFLAVFCLADNAAVYAQSRNLPKAGFPVYTGSTEREMPSSSGLSLSVGMSRNPKAPPSPYPPGEPDLKGQLVQWHRGRFPLRIWISMGQKLPEVPFSEIKATRPDLVFGMLQNPQSIWSLEQAQGWKPEMNEAVANGIEQWREFESEGLISFAYVDKPEDANVLVFFVDRFVDASAPGGLSVKANTAAKVYPAQEVRRLEAMGKRVLGAPVVIEFQVNEELYKLQGDAAHEFGHALGIKAHSPYREDLMFVDRLRDTISPSDKATLRWLYKQQAPWWML